MRLEIYTKRNKILYIYKYINIYIYMYIYLTWSGYLNGLLHDFYASTICANVRLLSFNLTRNVIYGTSIGAL